MINYCMQCGKPLILRPIGDEGEQKYCTSCNKFYFDNPACCVLVAIINEHNQVLLLRQSHISATRYTLCSGYLQKGETMEDTVAREVMEETGQRVLSCEYVQSYYFSPKNLIMPGYIAYVQACPFNISAEVDALAWFDFNEAIHLVARDNNYSGIHLDNCIVKLFHSKK